jgi:hypothetical protein
MNLLIDCYMLEEETELTDLPTLESVLNSMPRTLTFYHHVYLRAIMIREMILLKDKTNWSTVRNAS